MADVLTQTDVDLENGVSVVASKDGDGIVRIMVANHKWREDRDTDLTITVPASVTDGTSVNHYLIDGSHSNYYGTGSGNGALEAISPPSVVGGTVTITLPPRSVHLLEFGAPPPAGYPTVDSFDPAGGIYQDTVVVTGTNLTGATLVSFNAASAPFVVDSDTQITAQVPIDATTGPITVVTPNGIASSADDFVIPSMTLRKYVRKPSEAQLGYVVFDDATTNACPGMGASVVRSQFSWDAVEDYDTGDLALTANMAAILDACVTNNMQPFALAAFGPPWRALADLTVASDTAPGATVIPVVEDPSYIDPPYCYAHTQTGNTYLTARSDNYGTVIDSVGANEITISAATSVALTTGQKLSVIRRPYTALGTDSPTDPSLLAYVRYCRFLAQELSDRGLNGWVEIWNELVWASDTWQQRALYYDDPTGLATGTIGGMQTILAALGETAPITGVQYVNGASEKTGSLTLLHQGVLTDVAQLETLWGDSIHPYGVNPEAHSWYFTGGCGALNLDAIWGGSNFVGCFTEACSFDAVNGDSPLTCATECGSDFCQSDPDGAIRYLRRRVASLWGGTVSPACIYAAADDAGNPLDVITSGVGVRMLPMMDGLAQTGADTLDSSTVPVVVATEDVTWDVMQVSVYGVDSVVTLLWQRTSDATDWIGMPRPAAVNLKVVVPDGYEVVSAIQLETGDSLPIPGDLVFPVIDDILMVTSAVATVGVPVNTAPPEVTGSTVVGHVLTSSTGTWTNSPTSYAYQWQSSPDGVTWTDVTGETDPEYILVVSDEGFFFRVGVTAENDDGPSDVAYSESVGPVTPSPTPSEDPMAPCTPWITGDDVAECCNAEVTDSLLFDAVATQASDLLFSISGRLFAGECGPRTVRPSCSECWCGYQVLSRGYVIGPWDYGYPLMLCDSCLLACDPSLVKLAGVPVREVTEVKINGDVLDPGEYRIFNSRYLQRLNSVRWPVSQNLGLADTEDNTFSVTYTFGADPPPLAVSAAASIACEMYKACNTATMGACALPTGVTRITRQGITIDRLAFTSWGFREGRWATGLPLVDAFLASVNPAGLQRRPVFWAPGKRRYAQEWGN